MLKREKYIKLNSRELVSTSIFVVILVLALTFILGHKSVFTELQISVSIISLILFLFLFIGLYRGTRIKKEHVEAKEWNAVSLEKFKGCWDAGFIIDAGGIIEFLASILLWIVVSLLLIVVLFLLTNIIWGLAFFLFFILYWVFYRAYRQVFIKSRKCRGNIIKSLLYSIYYTLMYSGWILLIMTAVRILKKI
ncbi:MAG: hypothetical protein ACM3KR_00060 [Deltaproteobacteria bacterium]